MAKRVILKDKKTKEVLYPRTVVASVEGLEEALKGNVQNLAGSASDEQTVVKAANDSTNPASVTVTKNSASIHGRAGDVTIDDDGVNISAGNSGFPNAIVKVNGQPVATQQYVTNAAAALSENIRLEDGEDLTVHVADDGKKELKLADKSYAPAVFSGLGRKYLRKNYSVQDAVPFNGFVEGVTVETAGTVLTPTAIFFDTVNKWFVGQVGLKYYNAWKGNGDYEPVSETKTYVYNGKSYTWDSTEETLVEGEAVKNVLTQAMANTANTIYHIQYDYNLNGQTITLPANVTLQFDGGSLANGTIVGNHTKVSSENVCFKKSLEFSGSWDGIIYTKWLEFVSADDEYSEVNGVVTRNPNPTDNTLVFKQLEAILNGSDGGKVVFEKGFYQTGIINDTPNGGTKEIGGVTYPCWKTNVYVSPEWISLCLKDCKHVDIDLNGSTIKMLRLSCPMYEMAAFVNCDYASIHGGILKGSADNFDYPDYVGYDEVTIRSNYELCYGIYQAGGYLDIHDLDIAYFQGDCIVVGSSPWYDGERIEYQSQGFNIHDCEVSYCGRNGITVHSSYNGAMNNVKIHNIGSDAGNGEIGSDGIKGQNPRSGIDMEFEDGIGLVGKFVCNNLTITDCNRRNFTCAAATNVKSLTFNNLRSIGKPMLFSNMRGEVNVNSSYIETSSDNFINPVVTYNDTEILLTSVGNSLSGGTTFNRCYIHDNVEDATLIFSDNYASANPAAYFNGCKLELHSTLFKFHVCKNCDITFLGSRMNGANGLHLYNCIVKGELDESNHSTGFCFTNNSQSVSNDIYFEGCTFVDLRGSAGSSSAGFYNYGQTSVIIFKNCTISNCIVLPKNYGIIKADETTFADCSFWLYTPSSADTGLYLDGCKLTNASISQAGYVRINNSNIHLISGNYQAYHNNHYIVKNSNITDTGTAVNVNDAFTIDAENSSFTFNKAYKSTNMHFKNCIIGGLITEATFAGTKNACSFETPLPTSGTTAQRPSASVAGIGFKFFDTDLNSPVYSDGTNWVLSANGGEDEIDHGTSDTTFALTPNVLHKWGEVTALTLTLAAGTAGKINEYMFQFTSGTTPTVLSVPNTVNWVSSPNIEANTTYQASIVNNIGVIVGV